MKDLVKGDELLRKQSTFAGCEKGKKYTFKEYVLETLTYQIPFIYLEEIEGEFAVSHFEKVPKEIEFKEGDLVKVLNGEYGSHRINQIGRFLKKEGITYFVKFENSQIPTLISNIELVETPKYSPCTYQSLEDKEEIIEEIPKESHIFIEEEEEDIYDAVRQFRKDHPQVDEATLTKQEATKHDSGKPSREFESGMKRDNDENKPYVHSLQGYTRLRFGYLTRMGARNYGDGNFLLGSPSEDALKSLDRHLAKFLDGDRSEDHLAAMIFNIQLVMLNEKREGMLANHYFKNGNSI